MPARERKHTHTRSNAPTHTRTRTHTHALLKYLSIYQIAETREEN